ncbi:hypothetical protein A9762_12310 [Pandoraea sp. ISTKB]|nr:hypothetical protein A9762_12310 [Pandoraea sp. ISTKB]
MRIHAGMDLVELIPLMGKRARPGYVGLASMQEASDMRQLLVRDFDGEDTNDIEGHTWHLYCCAVDPSEQSPNVRTDDLVI